MPKKPKIASCPPPAPPSQEDPVESPANPAPGSEEALRLVQGIFQDYIRELERGGAAEAFGAREAARCNDCISRLRAVVRSWTPLR